MDGLRADGRMMGGLRADGRMMGGLRADGRMMGHHKRRRRAGMMAHGRGRRRGRGCGEAIVRCKGARALEGCLVRVLRVGAVGMGESLGRIVLVIGEEIEHGKGAEDV